jgi:hypothetical protein
MKISLVALTLFLCAHTVPAQQASLNLHGSWSATAGQTQVFWGTWTAQATSDKPNVAEGSWALLSRGGEVLLEGTWAAQKAGAGWQGTWAARTLQGRLFSGTWTANMIGLRARTLKEMLERTAERDIVGSWRSGRYQGNWRLSGAPPQQGLRWLPTPLRRQPAVRRVKTSWFPYPPNYFPIIFRAVI